MAHGGALGHSFATPVADGPQTPLVERDGVGADWVRGVYVVTDASPIAGGSRRTAARARTLDKPVVRGDARGRLWPDPPTAPAVWSTLARPSRARLP